MARRLSITPPLVLHPISSKRWSRVIKRKENTQNKKRKTSEITTLSTPPAIQVCTDQNTQIIKCPKAQQGMIMIHLLILHVVLSCVGEISMQILVTEARVQYFTICCGAQKLLKLKIYETNGTFRTMFS